MTFPDARDADEPNPYQVTLDELEQQVHVPVEDQVTSQPGGKAPAGDDWDEQRRQLRLAGGA